MISPHMSSSSAVSTSSLSEYLQLQSEMRRMGDLLTSIRKQSASLLVDSEIGDSSSNSGYGTSKKKALSLQQKRELSASSWAKSSTVRKEIGGALSRVAQPQQHHTRRLTYVDDENAAVEEEVAGVEDTAAAVADLVAVDRYLKTSAPRYTMGQRRYSGSTDGIDRGRGRGEDTAAPGQYEPSIDQLSTSKRARTCTFSTTPRPFLTTTTTATAVEVSHRGANTSTPATNDPVVATQADGDDDHGSIDEASTAPDHHGPHASAHSQLQQHHRPSKGVYSFGKQTRFSAVTASSNAIGSSPTTAAAAPLLDLDRAERAILPHSSSVQFVLPVHHKRRQHEQEVGEEEEDGEGDSKGPVSSTIDGLSYRTRVTNITSMHSTGRHDRPPDDVPGPGAYSSRAEALSTHRRSSSACRYHPPAQLKNSAALTHKLRCEQDREAQIGPGSYHPDKGLEAVSYKTLVMRIHPAESKSTPQLQRRAYFEQKAKDMREAHDFMRDSSLAVYTLSLTHHRLTHSLTHSPSHSSSSHQYNLCMYLMNLHIAPFDAHSRCAPGRTEDDPGRPPQIPHLGPAQAQAVGKVGQCRYRCAQEISDQDGRPGAAQ